MADGIITPVHPAMWHDHDINFARWLHPAMWHVALKSCQWIHQVAAPCSVIRRCGIICVEFTRWQHPATWQVALGWHAMEFAQMSAILEFYIWFRFWPYHRNRHVILHQSAKFLSKSDHPQQKTMTSCRFSRWQISAILDFRGPIMGSLKSPCTTSYKSSMKTIALNCLIFEKIAFLQFGDRQTNKQTDKQTNRWTRPLHEAALAVASGG